MLCFIDMVPYKRYIIREGIERKRKRIEVRARPMSLSEIIPAEIPPNTPPMSKIVERIPAALCDNCWPLTPVRIIKKSLALLM